MYFIFLNGYVFSWLCIQITKHLVGNIGTYLSTVDILIYRSQNTCFSIVSHLGKSNGSSRKEPKGKGGIPFPKQDCVSAPSSPIRRILETILREGVSQCLPLWQKTILQSGTFKWSVVQDSQTFAIGCSVDSKGYKNICSKIIVFVNLVPFKVQPDVNFTPDKYHKNKFTKYFETKFENTLHKLD